MRRNPVQVAVGKRMKEAAELLGLSAETIAMRMGVEPATIYRYWSADRRPSHSRLEQYGALVACAPEDFYGGLSGGLAELLGDIVQWVNLLQSGVPAVEAYRQLGGDPSELPAETLRSLQASADFVRRDAAALGGQDWQALSDDQKRQVLAQVRALARQNRGDPGGCEEKRKPPR